MRQTQTVLTGLKVEQSSTEQQLAQLAESTKQMQEELQQAHLQVKEANVQHQQELQGLHAERGNKQEVHALQLSQLQNDLAASKQAQLQASDTVAQLQSQLSTESQQLTQPDVLQEQQQQHEDAMNALKASLVDVQQKLDTALQDKASLQEQLASAADRNTAQIQQLTDKLQAARSQCEADVQQHSNMTSLLREEVSSLKQELSSRESTPDPSIGDLQQQLDSAKADAAKQANKLAQAEMRASLVKQQLQVQPRSLQTFGRPSAWTSMHRHEQKALSSLNSMPDCQAFRHGCSAT